MNTTEEILRKLRAGEPFGKIRTEVHSISKLYDVTGRFLDELQMRLENVQAQISQVEKEKESLETQVESSRRELGDYREEKHELELKIAELRSELAETTERLSSVLEKIDKFQGMGYTPQIMEKLEPMLDRPGETVLRDVTNVKRYYQAMKDFAVLKRSKTCLLKEIHARKDEKKKIENVNASLRSRTAELRLQARLLKDGVATVLWLLKKGYSFEGIKILGFALDHLDLGSDADTSISNLVVELKRRAGFAVLEKKVAKLRQEKADLQLALEDLKTKLKILEETTLRTIDETGKASIQDMRQAISEGQQALTAAYQDFDAHVKASMTCLQIQAKERVEWVEEQHRKESELERQAQLFETELKYGRFFEAFLASDDFISSISLPWMLHISQRLRLWISMKLPKETTVPPSSFQTQVGLINWPYNLATLSELVRLGLQTVSSRQNAPPEDRKVGVT